MSTAAVERLLLALLVTAAGAGALGTAWLVAGSTVPDWLLPAAAVAGGLVAWRHGGTAPTGEPAPRWLLAVAVALVAALTAWLAYGALATPSRHWDGAVAWDLKANVLGAAPTLRQPFFGDPAVYCHSRDYPLLQPLLMALLERWHVPGRLLFPVAYALLVAVVGLGARGGLRSGRLAILFAVAAAVTPMWLSPTSGSFDSGYGDALLTAAMAATALGAATGQRSLLGCGLVLVILQKPEGLPYAGLFVAAAWLHGDARMLRVAVAATASAGLLVLALQHDLRTYGQTGIAPATVATVLAAAIATLGLDGWLRRRGAGQRARWLCLLLLAPAAVAAYALGNGSGGLLGAHLAAASQPLQRLDRLPRIGLAIAGWAFGRGTFGLAFVVPLVVAVAVHRTRAGVRAPALLAWLLLAVPLWCVPFLTSPLDDLEAHLRASLPRVMLHWTGVAWLWAALQPIHRVGRRALGSGAQSP